ncbi:hypothetical protein Tco_1090126 [Tanacetum coccineum]|uniref:CASP-like protein n=1 Tax=Tanacetum coccineum TaxID=301880 RepID=A0ABQ5I3B4_9ASTR
MVSIAASLCVFLAGSLAGRNTLLNEFIYQCPGARYRTLKDLDFLALSLDMVGCLVALFCLVDSLLALVHEIQITYVLNRDGTVENAFAFFQIASIVVCSSNDLIDEIIRSWRRREIPVVVDWCDLKSISEFGVLE